MQSLCLFFRCLPVGELFPLRCDPDFVAEVVITGERSASPGPQYHQSWSLGGYSAAHYHLRGCAALFFSWDHHLYGGTSSSCTISANDENQRAAACGLHADADLLSGFTRPDKWFYLFFHWSKRQKKVYISLKEIFPAKYMTRGFICVPAAVCQRGECQHIFLSLVIKMESAVSLVPPHGVENQWIFIIYR